jgi:branched-chain amino acid transport system substrate-binding protein
MKAGPAAAADTVIRVGISLSFTGADAESAARSKNGAMLAFDNANASGELKNIKIDPLILDDGTATAGQYDPAQAATNARKMVSDKSVMAAIGPQMSGAGKAMSPILSAGDLAIITPSSTNPDITDPKFADQYRPMGKAIYFRTVTTDAYQGPNMANFFAEVLKVKSVYVLDDTGAYGVGLADAFQAQAAKKGIKVLGRDKCDPQAADYTSIFTKVKDTNPEAVFYGGVMKAGVKVAKQLYDVMPKVIKGGGDGIYANEMLSAVGFPAADGWYTSIAAPHLTDDPRAAEFMKTYKARFGVSAQDYSITANSGALVIIDAIKRVHASGKPITRAAVRDAIQSAKVRTIQGLVSFDANGDLLDRTVSVFRFKKDPKGAPDDLTANAPYIGVAPQS